VYPGSCSNFTKNSKDSNEDTYTVLCEEFSGIVSTPIPESPLKESMPESIKSDSGEINSSKNLTCRSEV
jgi:hypothetical protein